jgi:archaemetzincin
MPVERSDRLFWWVTGGVGGVAAVLVYLLACAAPSPPAAGQAARPSPKAAPGDSSDGASRPSVFSRGARQRRALVFAAVQGDEAFTRLPEPMPGDWLFAFREAGQTLDEYARDVVNRKTPTRQTLHLQPFSDLRRDQHVVLEPLREHTALYFDTAVTTLPTRHPERGWLDVRRGQSNADVIVERLARQVPQDSLGLFGLMGGDLFGLNLNFVFGEALLERRAGVYSLHRYGSEPTMLLRRSLKLSAHELGHMFGLQHCVFYSCVMNGCNSLVEMDRSPLHLCPVCLAKLQWNLRFDAAKRYRKLAAFYRRQGLGPEARFADARAAELEVR